MDRDYLLQEKWTIDDPLILYMIYVLNYFYRVTMYITE